MLTKIRWEQLNYTHPSAITPPLYSNLPTIIINAISALLF